MEVDLQRGGDWVHAQVGRRVTICMIARYPLASVHAPRRPRHIIPSGVSSPGAAVLLPMITSEMADIKERAALSAACSSHALQHKRATRW